MLGNQQAVTPVDGNVTLAGGPLPMYVLAAAK